MTKQEILDLSNDLTERKGEKVLNLSLVFAHVCQKICAVNRFWWRKRTFSFSTVASTPTYDLSSVTLTPSLTGIAFEEITRIAYVKDSLTTPEVLPVFDDMTIIEMIEQTATAGAPAVYTFDYTDYKTLRLNKPDAIYKVRVVAWCQPNPATDTSDNSVPLIPPWLHYGIVHGMERYIWRVIYGPLNPKYQTADSEYQKFLIDAAMKKQFTTNAVQNWISSEPSVQSS